jgi:hypothetical protein
MTEDQATKGMSLRNMNDLQLYLAVCLPTIAVLASLTVSLVQISGIREDIREIRADIKLITGKLVEIDNRVTRIEERLAR